MNKCEENPVMGKLRTLLKQMLLFPSTGTIHTKDRGWKPHHCDRANHSGTHRGPYTM